MQEDNFINHVINIRPSFYFYIFFCIFSIIFIDILLEHNNKLLSMI